MPDIDNPVQIYLDLGKHEISDNYMNYNVNEITINKTKFIVSKRSTNKVLILEQFHYKTRKAKLYFIGRSVPNHCVIWEKVIDFKPLESGGYDVYYVWHGKEICERRTDLDKYEYID